MINAKVTATPIIPKIMALMAEFPSLPEPMMNPTETVLSLPVKLTVFSTNRCDPPSTSLGIANRPENLPSAEIFPWPI